MWGLGTVFGAVLFFLAPLITQAFDYSGQFQLFLRIYAVWFPGSLWLLTVNRLLKSLEEVKAYNFLFRFVFPLADLAAVGVGVYLFQDFVVVIVGQVLIGALGSLFLTALLMRRWEFIPRVRGRHAARLRRRYVRFSIPLVGRRIVLAINNIGFFLLIPVFLSSDAAAVLAVGSLISSLISFPLKLNNQFISPVVSDLHERNQRNVLVRLYEVTTRMVLVGSIGLTIPLLIHGETVMSLFGPTFVEYTSLLPVFILTQFVNIIPGSDGKILRMTDRPRELMIIDISTAFFMVALAIPLTMLFGLRGLVVSQLGKATMNNSLQLFVLYYLDGYHPFTRLHVKPLLAGGPYLLIALSGKLLLPGVIVPLAGTFVGMVAYGTTLYMLGFTKIERRLGMLLLARYRRTPLGSVS